MNRALLVAERSSTAREILAYLAEHPHAQDSLEGIVEWWLLEREITRWTMTVRAGLAELVHQGLVIERKLLDGRLVYRINRRKLKQIKAVLQPSTNSSDVS